jgi:hypothetical protein
MQKLTLPPIVHEDQAQPSAAVTLGYAGPVNSRLSIGRSDVLMVKPTEILEDELLAKHLAEQAQTTALARLTLRVNFRPADGEQFTRALVAVVLRTPDAPADSQPFARAIVPERLAGGRFTAQRGVTLGLQAGVAGTALKAETSSSGSAELEEPYVVSAGLGEHDPEWRYQQTRTMPELSGSYEMGLIVEMRRHTAAEAVVSATAAVRVGRHQTNVEWAPAPGLARIALNNAP